MARNTEGSGGGVCEIHMKGTGTHTGCLKGGPEVAASRGLCEIVLHQR